MSWPSCIRPITPLAWSYMDISGGSEPASMDCRRLSAIAAARSTFFSCATRSLVAFRSSSMRRACLVWVHDWQQSSKGTPPSATTEATCCCGVRSWNGLVDSSSSAMISGDLEGAAATPPFMLALGVEGASSIVSKASRKTSSTLTSFSSMPSRLA